MKGNKSTEFDTSTMVETHTPAGGDNQLDPNTSEVRAGSDASQLAASVPNEKQRYEFILRRVGKDGAAVETLHVGKFVATGTKAVAQYLRRVAGNLAMQDET